MRNLLATTAIALAIVATPAMAQTQTNNAVVGTEIDIDDITVKGVSDIDGQAVGNSLSAAGNINVTLFASGDGQINNGPVTALVSVASSDFSGDTDIGSLSVANSLSSDIVGITTLTTPSGSATFQTNTGKISATTDISDTDFRSGANLTAAALGNNLNVVDRTATTDNLTQLGEGTVDATLTLAAVGSGGSLTGGATAVGNSANAGSITGIAARNFTQSTKAAVTASVSATDVTATGTGNDLAAVAVGNNFTVGSMQMGISQGVDKPDVGSTLVLADSAFRDGSFTSQAVGNLSTSTGNKVIQTVKGQTTVGATLEVTDTKFGNGDVSLDSVAVGSLANVENSTSLGQGLGVSTPTVLTPSVFASVDVDGVTAKGDVSISSTAVGNLANVSGSFGPLSQTTFVSNVSSVGTITNSTFNGALNVSTASIGNSISIRP
jgi:hypothetical protein